MDVYITLQNYLFKYIFEKAIIFAASESYLQGVSTLRVE
jgi:hypothetical protein